ncbi:MAG: hypothetical protein WCG62_00350 [Actinomycetes bacterium]
MKNRSIIGTLLTAALMVLGLSPAPHAQSAMVPHATVAPNLTISVKHAPTPPKDATDEYRCTWIDPHFATNQMMTKAEFLADTSKSQGNKKELHHAIAYIVSPSVVAQVKALDPTGTKGWTCFSSPLGATSMGGLAALPWLYGWSPGHGADVAEAGYGTSIPAGSLIVLQIHYNALVGKRAVTSQLNVWTEDSSTSSRVPLTSRQYVAAPDMPCVAPYDNVKKYPLCKHDASLAELAKRFGPDARSFTQLLEWVCNRTGLPTTATSPNAASATCTWGFNENVPVTIHKIWPHMHMLGKTFSVVLCHQDSTCANANAQTLLVVPSYNFDNQFGYTLADPVTMTKGDFVKVTCTYSPALRKLNPQTKKLPPRYITWGDGSSDEMCLGTLIVSSGAGS